MQVKLLRVLQENEIRRIGSSTTVKVNVRIIAATARDLTAAVREGEFREDLFYRLNVLSVPLPPLRKRMEDLHALCQFFLNKYKKSLKTEVGDIDSETMAAMLNYTWPGNIRELENIIQRGMILTDERIIRLSHIPEYIITGKMSSGKEGFQFEGFSIKDAQKKLEAAMIEKALEETAGNKSKASILLEISYPSLLNKIKEYSLQ